MTKVARVAMVVRVTRIVREAKVACAGIRHQLSLSE